jgi:non-specific protein-tyrosine kinase
VSPRKKLNLALGLLVGLAIGVGGAVLRETLDTSVKTSDDIQQHSGVSTIGVIGFDPDASKHPLIVHTDQHSVRAEAFRQLRTNLQFVDIDHAPRSIVVTSSLPGEGKTTTATNLAITLSQTGLRVLVVEADLRRPRVADYLGVINAVGLTSVLAGQATLDDVIQRWGDGRMHVLPSGPTPPNPSELLGSQGMVKLLRQLEDRYDLVLLDAPPLLPVTDAAVLATSASGVLMVVRHGKTTREQLSRAAEALSTVGAHVYGAVLNMAPTKGPDAYSYAYHYKEGRHPEPAVVRPAAHRASRPSEPDGLPFADHETLSPAEERSPPAGGRWRRS